MRALLKECTTNPKLASLVVRFFLGLESKPKVDNATWGELADLRACPVFRAPGGNPYHVAAALGATYQVAVCGAYLLKEVADLLPKHVHHVVLEDEEPRLIPIREAWRKGDPLRQSMVFELPPGFKVGAWELTRAERLVIRRFKYFGGRSWKCAVYRARDGSTLPLKVEEGEWPWFPAFFKVQVEGDELVLRAWPDVAVERLKKMFDLVVLSGIGPEIPLPKPVEDDLLVHLNILSDLSIVYEVSGTLVRPQALREWKALEFIRAIGLNEEELRSWSAALGLEPRHEEPLGLAELAVRLAEALGLESVVVHRPFLDLYVLRDPEDMALEFLQRAGAFASEVCLRYSLRATKAREAPPRIAPEGQGELSKLERQLTSPQRKSLEDKGFFRVGRFGVVPHCNYVLPPGASLVGQGDVKTAAVQSFFHGSLKEVRSAWTRPAMASGSPRERR